MIRKNSTTPAPKKQAKPSKRQARQFEPKVIADMDDFNQYERRQQEIAKQLDSDDNDVLWA
jgi:hypothetical protein